MNPNDPDQLSRAQAPSGGLTGSSPSISQGSVRTDVFVTSAPREGFLTGSFVWMFVGVLLSAVSAAFVMGNPALQEQIADLWLFLLIGQLVLVFAITFLITRIPPVAALGLFFVYALTMGLVLGVIVLAYVGSIGISGVVSAFAGAAAIFGGAALYGAVTKRDLTSLSADSSPWACSGSSWSCSCSSSSSPTAAWPVSSSASSAWPSSRASRPGTCSG